MVETVTGTTPSPLHAGFDGGRRRYVTAFGFGYFLLCQVSAPLLHFARTTEVAYLDDPIPLLCHALGLVAMCAMYLGQQSATFSAHLLTWSTSAGVWLTVAWSITTPFATEVAMFLATAPLLAGFLLSTRHVVATGGLSALGAAILGGTGAMGPTTAMSAGMLTVGATMVMGISAYTRRVDEAIIGGQARQLMSRTTELEAIMDAASEGMVAIDSAGRVVNANPAALALVSGSTMPRGAPLESNLAPPLIDAVRCLKESGSDLPLEVELGAGRVIRVHMRVLPGPRDGHVLMFQDITDERLAEEQRREAEVRRSEVEKLQEVTRFKSNLLNAASHELNTPLTPVRLQMELLRSPERGPLTDKQRHSLDILDRNILRLSTLIGDILDVAKLDGARLPLRCVPVSLEALVRDEVAGFKDNAHRGGLSLEADIQGRARVWGDPARLGQVLANLVSNAIKFTPKGGVRVGFETDGGWATVSVEDTGIGVPIGSEDHLFEPFSQLHHSGREADGAGMGLYLSKGIIEAHGGVMGYERNGRGSRFWFRIPTDAIQAQPIGQLVAR